MEDEEQRVSWETWRACVKKRNKEKKEEERVGERWKRSGVGMIKGSREEVQRMRKGVMEDGRVERQRQGGRLGSSRGSQSPLTYPCHPLSLPPLILSPLGLPPLGLPPLGLPPLGLPPVSLVYPLTGTGLT